MSLSTVRRALEKRLATLLPATPSAYENATFTPQAGVAYQRINLLPNTPDNSIQGAATYFERGLFQVVACFPSGTGPNAADTQAQAVRNHFKRSSSLVESGLTVNITDTPRQSPGYIDGDRWCVPVSIPWQCQIATP